MTWTKHTREITDEQFAEETTIDGSRIDAALDDTVSRFNALEQKDLTRRLVPCHYVWGWHPAPMENATDFVASVTSAGTGGYTAATGLATTGGSATMTVDIQVLAGQVTRVFVNNQGTGYSAGDVVTIQQGGSTNDATATLSLPFLHHWPWLHTYNTTADVLAGTGDPIAFQNVLRNKGCRTPGIINKTVTGGYPLGEQFAWTSELFIGKPAILDSVQLMLCLDVNSPNNPYASNSPFLWPQNYEPAGGRTNDEHTDMAVSVQVADIFDQRDRARDALEINRYNFKIERDMISEIALGNPTTAMTPSYPSATGVSAINGAAVQLKRLNVPIHLNATARISVVIPRYNDTTSYGWWGTEPWSMQYITMLVTTLEECE